MQLVPHPPLRSRYGCLAEYVTFQSTALLQVPIVFVDRLFGKSKLGRAEISMFLKGLVRLLVTT
jgi:hypothetical protein